MGVTCALEPLFVFAYDTPVPGGLIENEIVHVFGGRHDGPVKPDPAEASEWKWISFPRSRPMSRARPDAYTVWFRQYVDQHGDRIADWLGRDAN